MEPQDFYLVLVGFYFERLSLVKEKEEVIEDEVYSVMFFSVWYCRLPYYLTKG